MVGKENPSAIYFRRAMQLLVLAITAGLFVLGAQPVAVGLFPSPWDKLVHASVFAVLAVIIGLASGLRSWKMFVLAVAGAVLVGILDEWHQVYLPGREAGLDDLAADAVGGLLGGTLLHLNYPTPRQKQAGKASVW